jgi:uncharacterized damage-inducible protein DinB
MLRAEVEQRNFYATNCRASSTAHLAARFNSVFQSASRHLVHALNPSGGWILNVS